MPDLDHYLGLSGPTPPPELIEAAVNAMAGAYSPYSAVQVGIALATGDGTIYTGANIENASYGATICAERTALSTAVMTEGGPIADATIVVVGQPGDRFSPCGICRQVIAELTPNATVYFTYDGSWQSSSSTELLPKGFSL